MNEVTTQLKIRAVKLTNPIADDVEWLRQYSDHLIELTVKECAGVFPAEYDTVEGKTTIGKIIKRHFGVT